MQWNKSVKPYFMSIPTAKVKLFLFPTVKIHKIPPFDILNSSSPHFLNSSPSERGCRAAARESVVIPIAR